jgi:glucose/arabinose dehydrogenase
MRRACVLAMLVLASVLGPIPTSSIAGAAVPPPTAPHLTVTPIVSGLDHPWDVAFVPDGTMYFTERSGKLSVRKIDGTVQQLTADMSDLWATGETGLMGIESDPLFTSNRRIYTCQGKLPNSVQVVAWTIDANNTTATRANDPLFGGIMGTVAGRHGGCSLRVDNDGFLQVGTGDAAYGLNPQDPSALGGKTLRVNRFNGNGVAGNPFFGGGGDARIFTIGHRNVQGLALQPTTGLMWGVEQGTDRDDEVNRLFTGANYGWDPRNPGDAAATYDETHAMTDFNKFPNAVGASWSSGLPTLATSGGTFLQGDGWGTYDGMLAVTTLKDSTLRLFAFNGNGQLTASVVPSELNKTQGRLRGAERGPGGVLYLTTDNGGSADKILAVTPDVADGPAVASPSAGVVDYAVRAYDGQTLVREWNGSTWGAYTSLGGLTTASPDISSWGGGRLDVVVRGLNGAVYHQFRNGGVWSGWENLGGIATSGPTITSWGVNRADIFVRGLDGALWHRAWNGSFWQDWESLGGVLSSEPDVASWGANRLDIFARGADKALWHTAWNGFGWLPWESLGGVLSSGPGATSIVHDRVDVVVRGLNGQAYMKTWNSGWSGFTAFGGSPSSSPDASTRDGTTYDVLARGLDGGIYQSVVTNSVAGSWNRIG